MKKTNNHKIDIKLYNAYKQIITITTNKRKYTAHITYDGKYNYNFSRTYDIINQSLDKHEKITDISCEIVSRETI